MEEYAILMLMIACGVLVVWATGGKPKPDPPTQQTVIFIPYPIGMRPQLTHDYPHDFGKVTDHETSHETVSWPVMAQDRADSWPPSGAMGYSQESAMPAIGYQIPAQLSPPAPSDGVSLEQKLQIRKLNAEGWNGQQLSLNQIAKAVFGYSNGTKVAQIQKILRNGNGGL